tara:strand:+ start:1828 stop:2628 length:801 start_codon:yes stop_codon:yes gene_type:complete
MFELMAIQNKPDIAQVYENAGIDRIFIDLEKLGKKSRQKKINAVLNSHHLSDIKKVKQKLTKSKLLVRINPINLHSKNEILQSIDDGADIIMLPMFTTMKEIDTFLSITSGQVKTTLLFETAESICLLSEACKIKELNEIYVGLNDMHLSLNMSFLFEPLVYGIIDIFSKFSHENNKSFGFGGLATLENGLIPGKHILAEHARLNSNLVILSRAFFSDFNNNFDNLNIEVTKIKELYHTYANNQEKQFFENNKNLIKEAISKIIRK